MKKLRYIKDIIRKYQKRYLIGIACLIVVDFLQLVLPWIIGRLTKDLENHVLIKENLLNYALIIAALGFGVGIFRLSWRYLVIGASRNIEAEFRERLYEKLQNLSANFFNKSKTGDLMAHATNDINNIKEALGMGVALSFDSIIIPIAAIIMMFIAVGFKLTIVASIPLILLGISTSLFIKMMNIRVHEMQEAFSNLTETARENFSGIRVIKAYAREVSEINKFRKANLNTRHKNMRYLRLMIMLFPLVMTFSALSFALAIFYGGRLVINNTITLAAFVSFILYLELLAWPIASMGWVISLFQRGFVSLDRVNKIIDEKIEIKNIDVPNSKTSIVGFLSFKNVNFKYSNDAKFALQNITFDLEPGKTLGIVGRTGSGKSTVLNLIPRVHEITNGIIELDNVNIKDLKLETLRENTAYVPQDTFLFSNRIIDNIDFYRNATIDMIENVCRTAMIYDEIMSFPQKFDTFIGERGITLSGGQKQRIAIARALLSNSPILLLDDCLSAVDTKTEKMIFENLKLFIKNKASIFVSHRILTVSHADEIIVLEEGRVLERGTHKELLKNKMLYFKLHQKQLLEEKFEKIDV